nr:phospho-sugar mutase [Mycoplasmopsis bovis]
MSFSIMHFKAHGGINITASHNPKEYNGIKLYNELGFQMLPEEINEITSYCEEYERYDETYKTANNVKKTDFNNLEFISNRVKNEYLSSVAQIADNLNDSINLVPKNIKIVYSPLHGTGAKFVPKLFNKLFAKSNESTNNSIFYVKEHMKIDANFKYVQYPNPEKHSAYELLIKLGKVKKADILLMSDPDSDRVGLAVWHNNDYRILNGNETAIIIYKFLLDLAKCSIKQPNEYYIVYSFVSSNIPEILALREGINSVVVPTGFKWIGKIINKLSKENKKFMFAFEESYGSLINENLSKDKDALQSISILTKMASILQKTKQNINRLIKWSVWICRICSKWKCWNRSRWKCWFVDITKRFKELNFEDKIVEDFNLKTDFMKSNMIQIKFKKDNSWLALRPSGTEPKIKFYIFAFDKTIELATEKLNRFKATIKSIL